MSSESLHSSNNFPSHGLHISGARKNTARFGVPLLVQLLEGNLSDKPMAYLLEILAQNEATGHLEVASGSFNVVIEIGLGKPLFASSPIYRGDEALIDLFSWTVGKLSFFEGKQPQGVNVQEETRTIVERGKLYVESLRFLEKHGIDGDSILTRAKRHAVSDLPSISLLSNFHLSAKSIEFYGNVYGTLSLSEVAERCSLTRSEWVMIAARMLQIGLLLSPSGKVLQLPLDRIDSVRKSPICHDKSNFYRVGLNNDSVHYDSSFISTAVQPLLNRDTEICDNRLFLYMLGQEFARARDLNSQFTLAVFTISLGENADDLIPLPALRAMLEVLDRNKREVDILGHFGDRGFAILLPNVTSERAVTFVRRIRETLPKLAPQLEYLRPLFHFGLASAPYDSIQLSDLCNVAQARMHSAFSRKLLCQPEV